MAVLQDTVRQECEERFELTEALSEARLQLLCLQRGTYNTRSKSMTGKAFTPSPPVISSDKVYKDHSKGKTPRLKKYVNNNSRNSGTDSTKCDATDEGITFRSSKSSSGKDDEHFNRSRIAAALARQRSNSKTGLS